MQKTSNTLQPLPKRSSALSFSIANLQGAGMREYQQDAFALSDAREETVDARGLDLVLADGMGGIADGGVIAQATVEHLIASMGKLNQVSSSDSWERLLIAICGINTRIYAQYNESGGTTLIAAHIADEGLQFASIGDSSIFLLRKGRLFELNRRHEFAFDLFEHVLEGSLTVTDALENPQAKALSSFIGCKDLRIDTTQKPLALEAGDVLLLCSDGISDALTLEQIRQAMELSAASCVAELQELIATAAWPHQDNYTAIVVRCASSACEEEALEENEETPEEEAKRQREKEAALKENKEKHEEDLPEDTFQENHLGTKEDKQSKKEDQDEREIELSVDEDTVDSVGGTRRNRLGFWHRRRRKG